MKNNKKTLIAGLIVIAIVVILAIVVIVTISSQNKKPNRGMNIIDTETEQSENIVYDGKEYMPKKNIETYIFMGVDKDGKVEKATDYGEQGRCDVVMVLVRDMSNGTFQTLTLDRNMLIEQDSIDLDGTNLGPSECVLALAHENGDGLEMSAENVVNAVSNFLGGVKVDGYAALNMGAVTVLNHVVGGVTVTVEDDLTSIDATLKQGETIHLNDEQAFHFVRARMGVEGADTNEDRMRRQSVYMAGLKEQLKETCAGDEKKALEIYEGLEEYMVTNVGANKFTKIAYLMAQDKDAGSVTIEGQMRVNDLGYDELVPDEDSVQKAILELFYTEAE